MTMPRTRFPAHPVNPAPQASRQGGRRTLRHNGQRPRSGPGRAQSGRPLRALLLFEATISLALVLVIAERVF